VIPNLLADLRLIGPPARRQATRQNENAWPDIESTDHFQIRQRLPELVHPTIGDVSVGELNVVRLSGACCGDLLERGYLSSALVFKRAEHFLPRDAGGAYRIAIRFIKIARRLISCDRPW
jgi:hypothetical protein